MSENKRLDWLDSLRGIAMLNVIYFHICVYLLGRSTLINDSLDRWQMPLFFFVSGFLAFVPGYDAPLFKKRMKARLFQQLYPTIIVWLLFVLTSWLFSDASLKENLLHGIYDPAKVGYWFTFSLVQVFVVYVMFAFLLSYFRVPITKQIFYYIFVITVLGILSLFAVDDAAMTESGRKVWNVLSLGKTIKLVTFFFVGALVRMHWHPICNLMRHYLFVVLCLAIFVVSSLFTTAGEKTCAIGYLISRISGLAFMVSLFVCLEKYVSGATCLGYYLQRIGRNTLPIYLFHFFILLFSSQYFINDLRWLLGYLSTNPVVELISFTVISMVFAETTLVVDSLLKMVPRVHKVIFAK